MNPNPFGSPQGGAFQAPSGTMKPGLFQSFGQQTTGGQNQGMSFFQPSAFGQPAAMTQPAPHGATVFGQAPAFGQASSQLSMNQTAPFGQPSLGMSSSGFGSGAAPAFGQTAGSNQGSMFGQASAIGQTSAFGQVSPFGQPSPGFGSQPPAFGQQPTGFGSSQMTTGSSAALGQPQPLAFGQPVFGPPSATSATTGMFGAAQTVTQTRAMGSEFSFKPATEAVFKPIFSASPEPSNPQTTSLSSSPFGSSGAQTSSSIMNSSTTTSTTGFSVLAGAKSGTLGFRFSQPAAAPSISAQSNPLTTSESSGPSKTLQFTFSQPATPSSSSTKTTTTEPTTPSSFSFTSKTLQSQPAPLFGGSGFGQPPGFIDTKADAGAENKGGTLASLEDSNVFARLSKAPKRKDDSPVSGSDKPAAEEDVLTEGDSPRHPPKRPLRRSRGPPAGLFGRALSSLRKDGTNPVRREVAKESQPPAPQWDEPEREAAPAQEEAATVAPLAAQRPSKEAEEKVEESEPPEASEPKAEVASPARLRTRTESTDSLSGASPSDLTTIHCRNVPPLLNKRDVIEKHFGHFGKVSKVLCRPPKNYAIVYFDDHASAAKAKKKGKFLQGHDLLIVWQKKKQSPGKKELRPAEEKEPMEEQKPEDVEPVAASSPLKRPPTLRPSVLDDPVAFSRSSPVKKSYQVKSLQFDPEPQKDCSAAPDGSERPTPSSLHYLVGQVAESAEEKFRLLEQRDKVLRQGRPKRTNLDMSKVFVGTCPDMCPEKERYMRETRKQLSMYEVIPRTEMVDHAAAIKEYSRSSADQEEPLPFELRPLPVLSMTMDYLVTRIMDQGHDNYRDWYDFVWNRTRGIRKDITQQRLCCPHTVSLIEKCTRFHVHCAHHLCEEQMSSFDAKINNENMTKCLQSLKEMYEDLDMRQVYCPHEAEFRQYNVLLKLNEGDILREVQQFRDVVRNSPEVKFAVQAFAAVNSNNFVRFFKLVKKASYLASCLLHRYFNQVRAKALKTLNMAHAVGLRSTAFPVDDIVRMLMFRDASDATDFIQQYGLNVNDGMVELSRLSYQEPELPLSQKKSEVILAKKTVLIGEVVNGGPLPNPPQHIPVCSFDSQNKYKGEVPLAEPAPSAFKVAGERVEVTGPPSEEAMSQVVPVRAAGAPPPYVPLPAVTEETGEPAVAGQPPAPPAEVLHLLQPIAQPQPVTPAPPPPKPQPVYTDEDIMAELDGVIGEVLDVAVREVADAAASYTAAALVESSVQVDSLVAEVLGQLLQEVSSIQIQLEQERVAEEKRRLEEAQRKKEHEAFLVEFGFSLCTTIVDEVLNESIQETAASEIRLAVDEKAERVAKCTEQVCSSLIEDTLQTDISVLVEGLLEAELQLIHKYIKRWRDVVAVRRQLKRQMRSFPAAPCCVDPRFKLKALAPSAPAQPSMQDLAQGFVNLGNTGMVALSSTSLLKMRQASIRQMRVHYYYQRLLEETVWAPLDLPALLTENIPNPADRIFWKAVLLLPSDHETVASLADRILSDWLEVKFGGEKTPESLKEQADGTLQTLCVTNTLQEQAQRTHKVHISVKASRGPLSEVGVSKMEESRELQGAGALVMLLPALPAAEAGQDEQDVPLLSALLQLKQLQQATAWHCPLPLVVLVPGADGGPTERQRLGEALMLDTLLKEGLISEYTFFFIPDTTNDLQGTKQLSQALTWLLPRAPPPFPLTCQSLLQLIDSSLTHAFIPRVAANCQERLEAALPSQDPAPIILLYNALLAHLAEKVSSEELSKLSWPPGEFCMPETLKFVPPHGWNSADQLGWLHETILSLQLPMWEPSSEMDSWSEACTSIFNYAARIKVSDRSQLLLVSRLDNLLERVRLNIWHTQTPRSKATKRNYASRRESAPAACGGIPWDDVLAIFIEHKLKDWCPARPPVCEDALTEDGDVLVYFLPDTLKEFQPPDEWTQAVRKTHQQKQQETDGTNASASYASSSQSLRQRLFQSQLEPVKAAAASAPHLDITHTPTAQELLAHRVLQGLEEEKAENKRSMEQLQRWLDGEPLDQLSTPLFIPSSTLLSMPTTIRHPPAAKTRAASGTKEPESYEPSEGGAHLKAPLDSMSQRLAELQRQILASHEEELACRLKLNALMSIVDD